jgi:hypothetical protein
LTEPSRNPFKPSAASVATSTAVHGPRPPAPLNVRWAVSLYILSLALCFVLSHILTKVVHTATFVVTVPVAVDHAPGHAASDPPPRVIHGPPVWVEPVADGILDSIPAWLLYKVMRRRGWARIVLVLVSGLGFWMFSGSLERPENVVPVLGNVVLELVALGLLFTPSANRWFKSAAAA